MPLCILFLFIAFRINRGDTVSFYHLKPNDPAQRYLFRFIIFTGSFDLSQLIRIFKELLLSLFVFCFQYTFAFIAARMAAVALLLYSCAK
jgi:hypothetical protein